MVLDMRTSKPISTISYNSPEFLRSKIGQWKKAGLIEFGMWIYHRAETGEKDHFHVLLRPARLVQTMDLELDSCEFDPNMPDKPLKMVGFRVSKETEWLLYTLHDPVYLREKALEREYVYCFEDYENTDEDTFNEIISHCTDERKGKLEYRLVELIQRGMTWAQIVQGGFVPIRQMAGAKMYYDALAGYYVRSMQKQVAEEPKKDTFEQLTYNDPNLPW